MEPNQAVFDILADEDVVHITEDGLIIDPSDVDDRSIGVSPPKHTFM